VKQQYGMGRLPFVADERDANYTAMRLAAMIELGLATPVEWKNRNRVLDQGHFGTCVAAGTLGLLNTDDEQHNDPKFKNTDIMPFFMKIPGHGALPDGGAEVREGLKAAKTAGLIEAYALLRTEAEIDEWLDNHGPVLVGTVWSPGMCNPKGDIVNVDTVNVSSGHCWFFHEQELYYLHGTQSWGERWGDHGLFRVHRSHWLRLHRAGGEAWAVVQALPKPRPSLWSRIRKLLGGK